MIKLRKLLRTQYFLQQIFSDKLLLIVIDGQKNNNNLPPKIYWENVLDVTFLKNERSESHILIDPIKRYPKPPFVL